MMLDSLDITQQELPITSYFTLGKKDDRPIGALSKKRKCETSAEEAERGAKHRQPNATKKGKQSVLNTWQEARKVSKASKALPGSSAGRSKLSKTRKDASPASCGTGLQKFFGNQVSSRPSRLSGSHRRVSIDADVLDLTVDDDPPESSRRTRETPVRPPSRTSSTKVAAGNDNFPVQSLATPPPTNQPKKRSSTTSNLPVTRSNESTRRSARLAAVGLPTPDTTVRKPGFSYKPCMMDPSSSSSPLAGGSRQPAEDEISIPPLLLNTALSKVDLSTMELLSSSNSGSIADDERSQTPIVATTSRTCDSEDRNPFISADAEDPFIAPGVEIGQSISETSDSSSVLRPEVESSDRLSPVLQPVEEDRELSQAPFILSSQSQYLLGVDVTPRRKRTMTFWSPTRGGIMSPSRRYGAIPSSQTQEEGEMSMAMPPPPIPDSVFDKLDNIEIELAHSPKSPHVNKVSPHYPNSTTPRDKRANRHFFGSSPLTSPAKSPGNTTPSRTSLSPMQRRAALMFDSPCRSPKKSPRRNKGPRELGIQGQDSATEPESDNEMAVFMEGLGRRRIHAQHESLTEAESDTELIRFAAGLHDSKTRAPRTPSGTGAHESPRSKPASATSRHLTEKPSFVYEGSASLARDGAGPSIEGRYRSVVRNPLGYSDASMPSAVREFMDMFGDDDGSYPDDFPRSLRC
ncbi:hypothetical protein BJ138DRAFT_1138924 [Hygrophoropsis aurantiaca]|uniref:Uncharacterized protein n=1 Tax=Hygrophoropsis aurantiaca TaxID=72124 RepID=A0ACB8ASV1_9AGAM|nr:hypothetical protein BJ138DRAFT_1138924 [Hygrophoropsis aurantiaca]